MIDLVLPALDGSNPLGFFAALGLLNALSDDAVAAERDENGSVVKRRLASLSQGLKSLKHGTSEERTPTLAWRDEGTWSPVIRSSITTVEGLIELLLADLTTWKNEPVRNLRYAKNKAAKGKQKEAWDLKPPPKDFRRFAGEIAASSSPLNRRAVDFLAAFATETAADNNDNTKPTALHFTAGQQEFLKQVDGLVNGVTGDDIREAIVGPWRYARPLPVLGWDATTARDYALRADDPSKDKKQGVPGADWLAFRGLSFFRVAARRRSILTTGVHGGWKEGAFRWPLWTVPVDRRTAHSVLTIPGFGASAERATPEPMSARERRLRGIGAVYQCAIHRSDQGGYGSFSAPARI